MGFLQILSVNLNLADLKREWKEEEKEVAYNFDVL